MPIIYGLKNPNTGKYFYVGYTAADSPETRLIQHLAKNILKNIQALTYEGILPIIEKLEEGVHVTKEHEKQWMAKLYIEGEPLENMEGLLNYEERAYIGKVPANLLNKMNLSNEDKYKAALQFILKELPLSSIPIVLRVKNIAEWALYGAGTLTKIDS